MRRTLALPPRSINRSDLGTAAARAALGLGLGLGLAMAVGACTSDDGAQPTDTEPTTGDGTTAAPECVETSDCGECMLCGAGVCVPDPSCDDTGSECAVDEDCGDCGVCDGGVCMSSACEDSSGGAACDPGTWCEQGVSWCDDGTCVDVPAPVALPACAELPEAKPVEIEPQIQNVEVRWLDFDGADAPDIVASAAGSLNSWLAPDWALSKTALLHEGGPMDVLRGGPGPRVIELGVAAQELGLHSVEAAGGFTALGVLTFQGDARDIVAFDGDGDGVDEAVARGADSLVHITTNGDMLSAGTVLFEEATTDVATLRGGARNQLVAGRTGGTSVVIELDDGGQPVVDEGGLVNPWGAELVVAYGGKYGLIGLGAPRASAVALSTSDGFETVAGPAGPTSAAAYDAGTSVFAIAGQSELLVYPVGRAGPECTVSVPGGPFDGVSLGDLGGGTMGIAVIVAGDLQLFTLADVLN